MHKVSDVLAERFSQDPLETYFQHFSKPKSIQAKATGKVSDENINFESDRISSMSEKIQTTFLAIFKSFKQPSDT